MVASVLFEFALSKMWPQHLLVFGIKSYLGCCSQPQLWAIITFPRTYSRASRPVEEIISLAEPILAKFHIEGSWVVFWSHKHSSLSLLSRTIQFLDEKLFDWPCPLIS